MPSKTRKSEIAIDIPPRTAATGLGAAENGPSVPRRTSGATSSELSFAQQRLWFLNQINPDDTSVNLARAVSITGPLKQDVLHRSLQSLVCRHESLRTTFATTELYAGIDSKPARLVAATGSFAFDLIDAGGTPAEEVEATARRLALSRVTHKFDLSLGPLAIATLIRVDDQFHILLVTAHRIVADEESLRILFRELWQVYAAGGDLKTSQLAPMPIQYVDFAARQLMALESEAAASEIEFWRKSLEQAPPVLELPTYRLSAPLRTPAGASVSTTLDQELVAQLRALADAEHVSLRTVLLSAFTILLSRYSRQEEIVVGLQLANRHDEEVRNLVGPMSNLLPLRVDLSCRESFAHLLRRLEDIALEAHKRAVPFEKLLQELKVERSLTRPPVVQVTFDVRDDDCPGVKVGDLTIEPFPFDGATNNFDLNLDVVATSDRLECCFRYNTDVYDPDLIGRLASSFQVVLQAIVEDPLRMISTLPLLTRTEREQVLVEWNQTETAYPHGQCIQELFEAQAARTPEAVAVVDEQQRLTYAELDQRANQLARRLRREGVGCESLVAVCL
ncbi:MAG: hypothetical protein V7638_3428, partial [Acidobacteriota bacterium]